MLEKMNTPHAIEQYLSEIPGYISPERLKILERVFNTVCKEAGIFDDAILERKMLATELLHAVKTMDLEYLLAEAGHTAVAKIRRRVS